MAKLSISCLKERDTVGEKPRTSNVHSKRRKGGMQRSLACLLEIVLFSNQLQMDNGYIHSADSRLVLDNKSRALHDYLKDGRCRAKVDPNICLLSQNYALLERRPSFFVQLNSSQIIPFSIGRSPKLRSERASISSSYIYFHLCQSSSYYGHHGLRVLFQPHDV